MRADGLFVLLRPGCNAGNAATDPLEVAVAFGRANIPKLSSVLALGAQITAQPDSIEATEVEGVVKSTEAALRVLLEELARQEARTVAVAQNVPASLCTLLERPETAVKEFAAKCLERLASIVQGRCAIPLGRASSCVENRNSS
eukprot:COSAG02_NODE_19945_length_856_cov_1.706737_2_plen_144_part_00